MKKIHHEFIPCVVTRDDPWDWGQSNDAHSASQKKGSGLVFHVENSLTYLRDARDDGMSLASVYSSQIPIEITVVANTPREPSATFLVAIFFEMTRSLTDSFRKVDSLVCVAIFCQKI